MSLVVGLARFLILCAFVLLLPALATSQTPQPTPGWYKKRTLDHVRGPFSDLYTEGRVGELLHLPTSGDRQSLLVCPGSIPEHR